MFEVSAEGTIESDEAEFIPLCKMPPLLEDAVFGDGLDPALLLELRVIFEEPGSTEVLVPTVGSIEEAVREFVSGSVEKTTMARQKDLLVCII